MKQSVLAALAVLTICGGIDRAAAAGVPLECNAPRGETCYFKIFYTPRRARIVQLVSGMKDDIPDVVAGSNHYCVGIGNPPAYKCTQKPISAGYNN